MPTSISEDPVLVTGHLSCLSLGTVQTVLYLSLFEVI